MFLKYSTGQLPPKKSRGKGSQGKKTTDTPVADVNVSEESEPEPVKKKTASRRVVKKKVTISAADNIIPNSDVALELEQEAADTMKSLKESRKTNRRQPGTGGSSKGTGTIPGVPDESIIVSATSSERTEEDQCDNEEVDWIYSEEDDEKKDDDKSIDLEMTDDEETEDEFVQGEEQVNDDEDEEMTNAKVEDYGKGVAKISDVAKAKVEKTEVDTTDAEIKSLLDIKIQSEVPHIQSSFVLTVPVLVIFELSVLTPIPKTPSAALIITLPPPFVSTISLVPQKTTTSIPTPPIITESPTITTVVPESDALSAVQLRVAKLEKGCV
ncbi:hypothetical protein Tco_0489779 [Tanacetum coccineum]